MKEHIWKNQKKTHIVIYLKDITQKIIHGKKNLERYTKVYKWRDIKGNIYTKWNTGNHRLIYIEKIIRGLHCWPKDRRQNNISQRFNWFYKINNIIFFYCFIQFEDSFDFKIKQFIIFFLSFTFYAECI